MSDIGIILLAAGSSSRMGRSKQLLRVEGEPLLLRAVNAALGSAVEKIVVVLGADEEAHKKLLVDLPVDVVVNEDWQKGIGSSIKAGLNRLLKNNARLHAVIILVCDQPLLKADHINRLLLEHNRTKKDIVASAYSSTVGVPALFQQSFFGELQKLPDDQGAKKIFQQYADQVATARFRGGEIDLDTMDDYNNFIKQERT